MDDMDDTAAELGDRAKTAQETIKRTASKAGQYVRTQAEETRVTAGRKLADTAGGLHSMADQMHDHDNPMAGVLMHKAADTVDRAADYVSATSVDQMWNNVEAFARRRPWVVVSAGLVIGVLLGRAIKSMSKGGGRRFDAGDFREF